MSPISVSSDEPVGTLAVVDARQIVTRFGDKTVHEGVDLKVLRGERVALVGGSGSGKTCLLRHIIGLSKPQAGEVRLFGETLLEGGMDAVRRRRQRFGVLFQQGALFSALNVAENIAFPLREQRTASEIEIHALVALKLDMVGLSARDARLMPAELSGGMVKRVALARALALEPELLLLDEPTAGLDPDRSVAFVELIHDLQQMLDLTVLLVSHDVATIATLASRVAVLADRRIVAYTGIDHPEPVSHPFAQRFFANLAAYSSERFLEDGNRMTTHHEQGSAN